MQREEKQLELSLEALISQVADLKNSLVSFIYKLENEYDRLTWPSVLDSFALLSGQLNTLNKVLKHEKTPLLRNQVIIPLVLSPDRDEEIMDYDQNKQTYNTADTNALVAAVAFGKVSMTSPPGVTGPVQSSQSGASIHHNRCFWHATSTNAWSTKSSTAHAWRCTDASSRPAR
uniref:Uncharacterized protein n=1 Tax=Sphaerodactylus townsendi TaxID=933632 RepID=A0ACB8F4G8_9SAUR